MATFLDSVDTDHVQKSMEMDSNYFHTTNEKIEATWRFVETGFRGGFTKE